MEVPINDFDDIRPLNNDEVKDAIESLIANEDFERAFRYINPDVNWKEFSETMRSFKTKEAVAVCRRTKSLVPLFLITATLYWMLLS